MLKNVKVGDKVIVGDRIGYNWSYHIETVTAVLKRIFKTENHSYTKDYGEIYGNQYSRLRAEEFTQEKWDRYEAQRVLEERRRKAERVIYHIEWSRLTLEEKEQIASIVETANKRYEDSLKRLEEEPITLLAS